MTTLVIGIVIGTVVTMLARRLLVAALLAKLRRGVAALAHGDIGPLLSGYRDDAVLHFHHGPHRWKAEYRGKRKIEEFLADFVSAGLVGRIDALWVAGPPWALTLVVRFDDEAHRDGERVYNNRTVLWARTRWGRIVEQRDFYEDTQRLVDFSRLLASR
jgi:ketosteroid isomerase-like protein